ncbi:MAG TPA: nitrite/sulfite reductase [Chloroflexota bacterium]|nr:nitrite/sulfite reductase [Chloroflexota bacterium]
MTTIASSAQPAERPALKEAPSWELVLKRNFVERLKRERFPLEIRQELPRLIEEGYEHISEDDIVRLQWWGLYHDKPKIGTFLLRVKIAGGVLSPAQLRAVGQLAQRYGKGYGELSTRQNIQLHHLELKHLPDVFSTLEANGLSTAGGCGDTVRNITSCPVSGIDQEELFDASTTLREAAEFFYGNREYSDLPRKHKITVACCPYQCNLPEMHCIALIGLLHEGQEGFAVRIGGGLSTAPRIARDLEVFVPRSEAISLLRALLDLWKADTRYRVSRVKARFKFMVDDYGAERIRELVEEKLGRTLPRVPAPVSAGYTDHLMVQPQRQPGRSYVGFPVSMGWMNGEQMLALADLAESYGGDLRITRQQNFILGHVPNERLDAVIGRVEQIGYSLHVNRLRGSSIGCTGEPYCNYAVTETKYRLKQLVEHLEEVFGRQTEGLRLQLDGCPHSCGQHWLGDIGIQGTTARERAADGSKQQAYDIYLRGGIGAHATIGAPLIRRVPTESLHIHVENLYRAYLAERTNGHAGEDFKAFCDRHTDAELFAFSGAGAEHAPRDLELAQSTQ